MKRLLLLFVVLLFTIPLYSAERKMIPRYNSITKTWATYPLVTIHDIQYVPPDSLQIADSIQASGVEPTVPRWRAQGANYYNDTVVVAVAVIAPYYTITYTQHGWSMLVRDTLHGSGPWTSALVRVGSIDDNANPTTPDTVQAGLDGFKNVEKGDVILLTARVEEFPTGSLNSVSQLRPIHGISIDIINSGYVFSPPPHTNISDFYHGGYSAGVRPYHVNYLDGEQWEGSYVKLTNLTVTSIINSARQTWNMVDEFGNQISEYDASYNFAITSGETPPINPDTSVTHFHVPPIGAVIDSIKGFITIASGGENTRGYRICPLFIGDVKYGTSKPLINTHRRYPPAPKSTDSVAVQVHVQKIAGGLTVGSVHLFYSLNGGSFIDQPMTMISPDSTYQGYIIDGDGNPYPANTQIRYFIKAYDVGTTTNILANSSVSVGNDTSQGFFFFTVLDRPLTIHDVQYTPYPIGRSGYLGAVVSVSGIVTADSADINIVPGGPLSQYATTCWYIQDGTTPWSGIWVVQSDTNSGHALSAMRRGDSVTVTGTVQEDFDVTRIYDSLVTIHSSGNAIPAPLNVSTSALNEPFESMLVRLTNTTVVDTGVTFADTYEYAVDDGSGQTIVRRDGFTTYSNIDADTVGGYKILHKSDRMDTIIGVSNFSHSRWKVIPRNNNDITAGEPYLYRNGWNMVSVGRDQIPATTQYAKAVLYPGAISNAFFYNGAYTTASQISHRKGYWIKFPTTKIIRQLGRKRTADTVNVVTGWNLIGSIGNPVPATSIAIYPPTNHFSSFYEYNGSYIIQDTLLPSKGLWVKASEPGYFIQSASSIMIPKTSDQAGTIKRTFNTLTVADGAGHAQVLYFGQDTEGKIYLPDYEIPPASPDANGFDVRYASGRIVETYPKDLKSGIEYGISLASERGPVKLSWNIVSADGKRFLLSDGNAKAKELVGQGSMSLGTSATLSLKVSGGNVLPKEFALSQNYPNPFNPSTKFEVSLPVASHLEIVIYNILGQKVASIADQDMDAGYHIMVWDGNTQSGAPASTGIYFARMNVDKFSAVRKIMLMK